MPNSEILVTFSSFIAEVLEKKLQKVICKFVHNIVSTFEEIALVYFKKQ